VLLAVSFFVLQHWLERGQLSDAGVYEHYAELIRSGQVPYRDFAVEYPPAALPAFLLPAYLPWSYSTSFAIAMGICGAGCLVAAGAALRAAGADALRTTAALLLIAAAPLALGSLFDTRFDLWPALLALAALVFVLRENALAAGALLGLAFAAKLWPAVLAPIALAYLWRRRGRRAAAAGTAAFVVAAAVCFLPFAVLSPGGVRHSFTTQLDRPLQVESLGAAALMAAERLGGTSYPTVGSHGGQALSGSLPDAVGAASSGVEILAVVAVWIAFARSQRPTGETVLVASAAAVAALLAFGKVFSPQFMIWLVPFVPLVRGWRGLGASGLLVAALMLTQTWFPGSYWTLALDHASPWVWYLLARDLAVVALAIFLAWPDEPPRQPVGEERARLAALESLRTPVE
jgi:hypothetical protein